MRNYRDLLPPFWQRFELDEIVDPQRAVDRVWGAYRGRNEEVGPFEVGVWIGVDAAVARTAAEFLEQRGYLKEKGVGYYGEKAYVPLKKALFAPRVSALERQKFTPGGWHPMEIPIPRA